MMNSDRIIEIMDSAIRDVTMRMVGISLVRTEAAATSVSYDCTTIFVDVGQGVFTLAYIAENRLLWEIAQRMKRHSVKDMAEVIEYVAEYYNIICGHIISTMNRQNKSSYRFGIPRIWPPDGEFCPKGPVLSLFYQSCEGSACLQSAG